MMHFNVGRAVNFTVELLLMWLPGRRLQTVWGSELAYGEESRGKHISVQILSTRCARYLSTSLIHSPRL